MMCSNTKVLPFKEKCENLMKSIEALYINKRGQIIGGKYTDGTEFKTGNN